MYLMEFLTVALVHLLAVASPGPDFAVVVRESVLRGRGTGSWTAFGVGCGILLHVSYSLLGIGLILSQSLLLFNLVKWLAAGYLVFLGVRALRAPPGGADIERLSGEAPRSAGRAFLLGLLTNGLNPKATLFFLSLFSVVIDPHTPLPVQAGYGLYLAVATGVWFCLVAWLFSRARIRAGFARLGHWFDRLMGVVLIGLGARLALGELSLM